MCRISDSQEVVIRYLQYHSPEVFMEIVSKLSSENEWSDDVEIIFFTTNKKTTAIDEAFVGMYNKQAKAIDLQIMSIEDFIYVIRMVTRKMIRKYPDHKLELRKLCDDFVKKRSLNL